MTLGAGKVKPDNVIVTNWSDKDIPKMQQVLEKPNWAPWLRVNEWQMSQIIKTFEKGQILIKSKEGEPLGTWRKISSIHWECGETGSWKINVTNATATYTEPKIWGVVKSGLRS